MIPITLSKRGSGRWITQHFGINDWKIEPMVIPSCGRCFGIFIFWKTIFENKIVYSITGAHLPPGTPKYTKYTGKYFFHQLSKDMPKAEPYLVVVCGGNINTPQNRFFYKKSRRHYLVPFLKMYPNIQITMYAVEENTVQSTMFLHSDGTVSTRLYHPIT
jgi:hypothetical protein